MLDMMLHMVHKHQQTQLVGALVQVFPSEVEVVEASCYKPESEETMITITMVHSELMFKLLRRMSKYNQCTFLLLNLMRPNCKQGNL